MMRMVMVMMMVMMTMTMMMKKCFVLCSRRDSDAHCCHRCCFRSWKRSVFPDRSDPPSVYARARRCPVLTSTIQRRVWWYHATVRYHARRYPVLISGLEVPGSDEHGQKIAAAAEKA
eukprot:303267-Rhodomonas_salina.1